MVKNNSNILGIVVCLTYQFSFEILAQDNLKRLLNFLNKINSNLFQIKTFVVGHLTATCDHLFGFDKSIEIEDLSLIFSEIESNIK